jgi:hypothetical protein
MLANAVNEWPTQSHRPASERSASGARRICSRLTHKFYVLHGLRDLDSAIAWIEKALRLTPLSHFALPQMLAILSSFYSTRLKISGDLIDLNNSISNIR